MTRLLPVQFQGIEEGADPKALPPGTLLSAVNCAMDKGRRLVKRAGTTGLAKTLLAGSTVTAGKRLLTTGDDIAIANTETVYARSASLAKWQPIDRHPALRVTCKPLADSTRAVSAIDFAISGRLLVSAYSVGTSNALYIQVHDVDTGKILKPSTRTVGTGYGPRVLISGSTAYVFYHDGSGTIFADTISLTTLGNPGTVTYVTSGVKTTSVLDVAIATISGTPRAFIAYEKSSGVNRTALADFVLSTGVAVDAEVTYSGTNLVSVCVAASASTDRVFLAFTGSTSNLTRLVTTSTSLGAVAGPTTIYNGLASTVFVDEVDSSNCLVGWVQNGGSFANAERLTTSLAGSTSHTLDATSERITFGVYAASKPWAVASRWYTAVTTFIHDYSTTSTNAIPQPSRVVVEIETADSISSVSALQHTHVATLENQTGWFPATGYLTKSATDSSGNVYIPASYRNREPVNATATLPVGWNVYRLAVSEGDLSRCARLGRGALCAAGAPFWFDGGSSMPYGFAHGPKILSANKAAGGAVVAGVYSYVACYVWRDANGVLHRSAPSPPFLSQATESTNLTINVIVSTASLSGKVRNLSLANAANPVMIELYRTTIGGTGPHYRLTLEPSYNVLANDHGAADVTLPDTKADSNIASGSPAITLASQAQLYTDTGELANIPPPAFITVATHRGRLVGIGPDLRTVWLSKDSTLDATLAPGFNEALTLAFTNDKTALASLDEKLVVFGADKVDVVHGDGPDDKGENNTWVIQGVQTDVGCSNPRSVATCPLGCIFESTRGIELLTRDLQVVYVGSAIEDTLALFPTITSAVLVADAQEVRFTCVASNGSTGVVLAWDYAYKIWFVRKYKDSADTAATDIPFVDAALIGGVYTMLTSGGQVYQETTSHKLDNGADWVERDVILAPISPGGSGLAWHRIKDVSVLGTSTTNHDLRVSFARDYSASYEQTKDFLAGSLTTVTGPNELARVTVKNQKCQAIKIRIQDLTPTSPGSYPVSTGDGPILEALALRVGVKDGPAKAASGQKG